MCGLVVEWSGINAGSYHVEGLVKMAAVLEFTFGSF